MNGEAAVRAADVLLCANGVRDILMRMAASAAVGMQGEELGMATPEFQDVPLGAVAFRKAGDESELIVSAKVVEGLMGTLEFGSAKELFASAVGVVIGGVVYVTTNCVAMRADDAVYAFRVTMKPPQI